MNYIWKHFIVMFMAVIVNLCLCSRISANSNYFLSKDGKVATSVAANNFTFQTKLVASNGTVDSNLGLTVGISGDTAIAFAVDGVHVFVSVSNSWTEQAVLVPSDGFSPGTRLVAAISGNTIVIGGSRATINSNTGQGAAYVFVRNGTTWTQQQRLTASDGAAGDEFGYDVSISDNTIIVGARSDAIGSNTNQGSAYVFVKSGETWTEQAKLTLNDGMAFDFFGAKVFVNGDTAAVTSSGNAPYSPRRAVHVFARSGSIWTQQTSLVVCEQGAVSCRFGESIAVSGDTLVAGNTNVIVNNNTQQGAAYVFVRSGTTWTQQQRLVASDGQANDYFGRSVAIEGETIIIGASEPTNNRRGSAYGAVRNFV